MFVGYHGFALAAFVGYGKWLRGPKAAPTIPSFHNKQRFSIASIFMKGSFHGV